jgi:hypothetical protein
MTTKENKGKCVWCGEIRPIKEVSCCGIPGHGIPVCKDCELYAKEGYCNICDPEEPVED